jgi:flagellar operon protein (TIGR03826 family)
MSDLTNCPNCGKIMAKNKFRDICQDCYKVEEKQFETVYRYMRKRENRAATIRQIVEATEVSEELILKFIKSGRIQVAHFPNLGYPCDKCGRIIRTGKLCERCLTELRGELTDFQKDEKRKQELREREKRGTYLSNGMKDNY